MNGLKMKRDITRSVVFIMLFFFTTLVACVVLLPSLVLSRPAFMHVVRIWIAMVYALERSIMGLDYKIRGMENLPKTGSYIVAAKHQSSYETMKLHSLFGDPAIILKKELLNIPLWGWYLKKSDVIAIDRSSPEAARESIAQGSLRMQAQNRPIIIFPQGTRVRVDATTAEKPYKSGILRIQEATNLPIIPMALNSGMFWPRSGFLKSRGTVIFKFLEPIMPGHSKEDVMKILETKIEEESQKLMDEALEDNRKTASGKNSLANTLAWLALIALVAGCYSYAWFETARILVREYGALSQELGSDMTRTYTPPVISGFPGKITLRVDEDAVIGPQGSIRIHKIQAQGWPVPGLPITIKTGPLEISNQQWNAPLHFDSLDADLYYWPNLVTVTSSALKFENFLAGLTGTVDLSQKPFPKLDLVLTLENYAIFMNELMNRKVIEQRAGMIVTAALAAMAEEDGIASVPILQKDNDVYVGPVRALRLSSGLPIRRIAVDPGTSSPAPGILPAPAP